MLQKAILIFTGAVFLFIGGMQYFQYEKPQRYLYLLLVLLTMVALFYELNSMGCYLTECGDSAVTKHLKDNGSDSSNYACKLADRPVWRIALIKSMMILYIYNLVVINNNKADIVIFFIVFLVLYFAANFEAFHSHRIMCKI